MTLFGNRKRAKQLVDFSSLVLGKGTYPTDLDGLIEWKDKGYIIIEWKHKGDRLKTGQYLALTRLVDDLQKTKPALLIVASHNTSAEEDVDSGSSIVRRYRYRGKWKKGKGRTVRSLVDGFLGTLH